jgi:hypothetical protein
VRYLITSVLSLGLLLALVLLVEGISAQEQPSIETPAAITTPSPMPTGPLTIQITGLEGAESIDDVWATITIPKE